MKTQTGPDQKWSWVVACSCFSISLILFGIYRTSGILLVAFISEYQVTREDSSWPLFLCFSIVDLTGLIVGPLGQKFGVRPITVVGTLVSALGVSLCFFAKSLTYITVCFGVIFGIGFGFAITLMPVIINEYFVKYRVTANGIANSGGCFGSVIFPPVYEYLLSTYGLNGCLLLTGGIILQLVISGALMRPPSWLRRTKYVCENDGKRYSSAANGVECRLLVTQANIKSGATENVSSDNGESTILQKRVKSLPKGDFRQIIDINSESNAKNSDSRDHEDTNVVSYNQLKLKDENESDCSPVKYKTAAVISSKYLSDSNKDGEIIQNEVVVLQNVFDDKGKNQFSRDNVAQPDIQSTLRDDKHDEQSPFLSTKSELDLSSVTVDQKTGKRYSLLDTKLVKVEIGESEKIMNDEVEPKTTENEFDGSHLSISDSFKIVLSSPMFYIIGLSNIIFFSSEELFYVINADFYTDKNVSIADVKYMFISFSVCDLIGRLCFGWVTDRNYLSRPNFMVITLVAIAVIYFIFPFGNSHYSLLALNCVYGMLIGATTTILFVLPADYLNMDIQAIAFGTIAFLCGTLTLMCSLLIGYFRDKFGSYSNIFHIMGAASVCCAVLWVFEKRFVKCTLTSTQTPKNDCI